MEGPVAAEEVSVSKEAWNNNLQSYGLTLKMKAIALVILCLANFAAIGYGGFRLSQIIPMAAWSKAIVYTPLLAGLLLAIIIYRKNLDKVDKNTKLPNDISEKSLSIYNPLLILSSIFSLPLLLPFALAYHFTDVTNYAHGDRASTTAESLRAAPFDKLAHGDLKNYKILVRCGFIQENTEIPDFTITRNPQGATFVPSQNTTSVKEWVKKAKKELHELEGAISDLHTIGRSSASPALTGKNKEKLESLEKAISALNTLWKENAPTFCPDYTGDQGGRLDFWDKLFLLFTSKVPASAENPLKKEHPDDGEVAAAGAAGSDRILRCDREVGSNG